MTPPVRTSWKTPAAMLMVMAAAMHLSIAVWQALLNNFAIQEIGFTGADIGILQSLREVPGFLAFTVVFVLLAVREQTLALVSLILMGLGIAATGYLPSFWGLCLTTMLMSVGFHYYETVAQSLALQWLPKATAARTLGRIVAAGSFAAILGYGLVYLLWEMLEFGFLAIYLVGGAITVALTLYVWLAFPRVEQHVVQHKHLFLRRRYWLYYALIFMSGARRQIFVVFAGFLLVQKFGFSVSMVAALYLANQVLTTLIAPYIGALISRYGERRMLMTEYGGLICVFAAYGLVTSPWLAGALYIIDHVFFAMAIASRTYFQKIADPADIAPTSGVSFTISHIAAIVIPAGFGLIWLWSPTAVFMIGSGLAAVSLALALLVPHNPAPGNETLLARADKPAPVPAAAE